MEKKVHHIIDSKHHELVGMISYNGSGWGGDFTKGNIISLEQDEIVVELEEDPDTIPDYFELSATPIVSSKFLELLKILPVDNYQVISVIIKINEVEKSGYYILNIIGKISCVDMEASKLKMYKSRIMRIVNLVPVFNNITEKDLFRIQEYPLAIVISNNIAKQIISANLTGINILPLEGWNDKHRF